VFAAALLSDDAITAAIAGGRGLRTAQPAGELLGAVFGAAAECRRIRFGHGAYPRSVSHGRGFWQGFLRRGPSPTVLHAHVDEALQWRLQPMERVAFYLGALPRSAILTDPHYDDRTNISRRPANVTPSNTGWIIAAVAALILVLGALFYSMSGDAPRTAGDSQPQTTGQSERPPMPANPNATQPQREAPRAQ
jgi:hypothetical protein